MHIQLKGDYPYYYIRKTIVEQVLLFMFVQSFQNKKKSVICSKTAQKFSKTIIKKNSVVLNILQ